MDGETKGQSTSSIQPEDNPLGGFFSNILTPGSSLNPTFLLIVDSALASLLFVFISLLYLSGGNSHFIFLIVIEGCLWASVKWCVLPATPARHDSSNPDTEGSSPSCKKLLPERRPRATLSLLRITLLPGQRQNEHDSAPLRHIIQTSYPTNGILGSSTAPQRKLHPSPRLPPPPLARLVPHLRPLRAVLRELEHCTGVSGAREKKPREGKDALSRSVPSMPSRKAATPASPREPPVAWMEAKCWAWSTTSGSRALKV